jgi:hypothetical protein
MDLSVVLGLAKFIVVSPVLREPCGARLLCQAAKPSYFLIACRDVAKMRNQSITGVPYMKLHCPRLHGEFEPSLSC